MIIMIIMRLEPILQGEEETHSDDHPTKPGDPGLSRLARRRRRPGPGRPFGEQAGELARGHRRFFLPKLTALQRSVRGGTAEKLVVLSRRVPSSKKVRENSCWNLFSLEVKSG